MVFRWLTEYSFLLILFPLIACALSVLHLFFQTLRRAFKARRTKGYSSLNGSNIKKTVDSRSSSEVTLEDEADLEDENSRLALHKTTSRGSVTEISRPRGATSIVVVELLCLLGQVGLSSAVLVDNTWGKHWKIAAISSLASWSYISVLACLRLLQTHFQTTLLFKLWNHTASLYCLQWLFTTILFRSAVVHPLSQRAQALMIAYFVLASLLALIAITTRRGNRPVLLTYEGEVEPSPEPLASISSLLTFSWLDILIWRGYQKPLELPSVWNVPPKEKADAVLATFRQYKKTTRLTIHLLKFFSPDLLFQQFWAFVSAVFIFVPTLLLKAILEYVEDPSETPRSTAWLYVILLLVSGLISGVADGQALWRGRKICIKLRSIMVGEIYAKVLRRKAASSGDTDMNASDKDKSADGKDGSKRSFMDKVLRRNKKPKSGGDADSRSDSDKAKDDTQVNSGTIINLMSVDSFKVAEISAYWHFLIPSVPVQLVIAITLLFRILGWSAIAGLLVMFGVLPINIYFSTRFSRAHKRIMSATDGRIHATNEVLQNVRIIKYFAWEERFIRNIDEKRQIELSALKIRFYLWIAASSVWFGVPMIITGFSFLLYTVVEKRPLYPSVAFTALSLFGLLRFPLDRLADMMAHVLESKVSIDRVEKFLNEDETGKYEQLSSPTRIDGEEYIGFKSANLSWGPRDESATVENPAFRLINMDIKFRLGGLNVVAGPTGSGKTSLLMALLGEMTLLNGTVHLPGGYDRMTLKIREDGLTDSVAYCAQQAWLVNDTIKQNIIFASPYDESRYQSVIAACALERDLEILEAGDSTLVGEKGIVVSGGQKQRISLARALYSNSRHILLDDCLSAVDSHTAQHIFEHCILGPLMLNRTCILVTHNIALCVPQASHVVALANGKIAAQGPPEKVMASGVLGNDVQKSRPGSKGGSKTHSRVQSVVDVKDDANSANGHTNGKITGANGDEGAKKKNIQEVKDANIRTEDKAIGAVEWKVIKLYLFSMGPWYFWFFALLGFTTENVANISTNVWIRQWANSYSTQSTESTSVDIMASNNLSDSNSLLLWSAPFKRLFGYASSVHVNVLTISSMPEVDNGYYLVVYAGLGLLYILICVVRLGIIFKGALNASRKLHAKLIEAVLRAKFKFFDTTPLGQITNRFSKDLQAIDQDLAPVAAGVFQSIFGIISIILLISVITPGFLFAGAFLTMLYIAMGLFYIQSSRDLKRLESAQRSPLYQQFGETLSGITTIRAYGDERRFIEDNSQRVNSHNRPFIFLWAANRWLALRVDFAGALVAFFAAIFVVLKVGKIDAGAAGLSLTYALNFNENILWLVRLYAENEQNMNHVERVKQFLDVEQEAPADIPETKPTGGWPLKGAVEFVDYTTSYRSDLDPVLKSLSFKIKAEEKVGIVGRTGAGKSSLALALFRGLEADSGKIFIDDVDIGTIGLLDLRENLTIVPQDPTLFTGTIRSNLDPFGLFTDEEILTALRQVHLIGPDSVGLSEPSTVAKSGLSTSAEHLEVSTIEDVETGNATSDLSAPAPIGVQRQSLSAPPVIGEDSNDLDRVLTNTHENTNVFTNLSSPVAESGTNLSQGQRQLLCLARALLKNPRVLLMDEATASIDYATDAKIQETLREVRGSTIITIAHRLQTIIDYDKVLVLDKGEVVEFAAPWELIEKEDGIFRGMCETSGDFGKLVELAKDAERKSRLVDV